MTHQRMLIVTVFLRLEIILISETFIRTTDGADKLLFCQSSCRCTRRLFLFIIFRQIYFIQNVFWSSFPPQSGISCFSPHNDTGWYVAKMMSASVPWESSHKI